MQHNDDLLSLPKLISFVLDKPTLQGVTLILTHRCNLHCTYCYNARFRDRCTEDSHDMSPHIAKRAIDFLLDYASASTQLNVSFLGGEPLLCWPLLLGTARYVSQKVSVPGTSTVQYSITTNGTLLNKVKTRYLRNNQFNVGISYDGDVSAHDQHRRKKNGKGSADAALHALQRLDPSERVTSVMTLTPQNFRTLIEMLRTSQVPAGRYCYVNLGRNSDPHMLLSEAQLHLLGDAYGEYLWRAMGDGISARVAIDLCGLGDIITRIHTNTKLFYGCRALAGIRSVTVDPDGDVWPCARLVGLRRLHLGHINAGLFQTAVRQELIGLNVDNGPCRQCRYRYLCGGACPADGLLAGRRTAEPWEPACIVMSSVIDHALKIYESLRTGCVTK